MRRHGTKFVIVDDGDRRQLMETAVGEQGDDALPASFYLDEWRHVVLPQEVTTRDAYLTARRVGRGTRLSRKQRVEVWGVLERYRELLAERGRVEWPDVMRETRLYIEQQGLRLPYRAVLADEVQDLSAPDLKLLRAIAPREPDSLFLVGDGHQRIYGHPTRLGACGIEIRGRSRRLKLNYRTTEEIRNRAVAILEGVQVDDLDGGIDSLKGYRSLRRGHEPVVRVFAREAEEAEFVVHQVRRWLETTRAEDICVAARHGTALRERYQRLLAAAGIDTVEVRRDPEAEARRPGVRLATMHRMKGLEFLKVLLAGVQEGGVPHALPEGADQASREEQDTGERSLLYVACTRARDELVIAGFGRPSPLLRDAGAGPVGDGAGLREA